jgi:hypothetical protein
MASLDKYRSPPGVRGPQAGKLYHLCSHVRRYLPLCDVTSNIMRR